MAIEFLDNVKVKAGVEVIGTGVFGQIPFSIQRAGGSSMFVCAPDVGVFFNSNKVYITSPTGENSAPILYLREAQSNGATEIGLRAPDSVTTSITYTLPGTAPTAGQVLSSTTAGIMSWVDAAAGTNIGNSDLTLTSSTRNLTHYAVGSTLNFVYGGTTRQSFSPAYTSFFSDFYLRSLSGSTLPL